ncbi:YkgJ family cysteine cluster protein [Chroococcus sp. FPU101]|uniref:YkgJ family cysteine cluster protein n=1 Tax=Chroococcus sp. FPU101 TaxID=1974212 RepID=UPI001A8E2AB3|nr:YkgJ family cysteine cluster protein [Chroococcus sp. FPU101]
METWQCAKQCGACCHLDPQERPDLEDYLSHDELEQYLGMVGNDGWCVNFDQLTRQCQIYDSRPRFCCVKPDTFEQMYQISPSEFNEFAIDCCRQQITGVYGENSPEMKRYNQVIKTTR